VELDAQEGFHNGRRAHGEPRYFVCKDKHGVFVGQVRDTPTALTATLTVEGHSNCTQACILSILRGTEGWERQHSLSGKLFQTLPSPAPMAPELAATAPRAITARWRLPAALGTKRRDSSSAPSAAPQAADLVVRDTPTAL
jgi:hypothetical protein